MTRAMDKKAPMPEAICNSMKIAQNGSAHSFGAVTERPEGKEGMDGQELF